MTENEPGNDRGGERPEAAPVVLAVQILSLGGLILYAVLALIRGVEVDAKVIGALVAFGVGLRPGSIPGIVRKAVKE